MKGDGETGFMDALAEYARTEGWLVAHFTAGQVRPGTFVTAVKYDGKGFPDLTMCRGERLVFVECKREGVRKLRPDQESWRDALRLTSAEWYLWNPLDWPEVKVALAHPKRKAR